MNHTLITEVKIILRHYVFATVWNLEREFIEEFSNQPTEV